MNGYEYFLYSPRSDYGTSPDFRLGRNMPNEGFRSLYGVSLETAKAIQQAGTAKWFKGVVWSERLCLDFDGYDAAERAERRIRELGYDYMAYDTGGRGGHFELLRNSAPSHLLPQMDKQWAKEHFPECDASIYTHLHPYRLEGTKHEKTGNRKELVSQHRGKYISLAPLTPRTELPAASSGHYTQGGKSIFDCFRVSANTVPALNGERHHTLVRLCYALRDEAQAPADLALWWLEETNKMFEEPKEQEALEYIVRSIYE